MRIKTRSGNRIIFSSMKYQLIALLSIILLISCEKAPPPQPEPTPTPTPIPTPVPTPESTPTPTPTPTPEPTPEPTPLVRTPSVGDKVYVTKKFNIEIEDGIIGFPIGKPVTVLEVDNDVFIVSDGKNNASKPADFFSMDPPDIPKSQFPIPPKPATNPAQEKSKKLRSDASSLENTLKHRESLLVNLKSDLKKLEYRIDQAGDERSDKGYDRDGGPRRWNNGKMVTLSVDASNIKELINNKFNLEASIEKLDAEIDGIKRKIDNIQREIENLENSR